MIPTLCDNVGHSSDLICRVVVSLAMGRFVTEIEAKGWRLTRRANNAAINALGRVKDWKGIMKVSFIVDGLGVPYESRCVEVPGPFRGTIAVHILTLPMYFRNR